MVECSKVVVVETVMAPEVATAWAKGALVEKNTLSQRISLTFTGMDGS